MLTTKYTLNLLGVITVLWLWRRIFLLNRGMLRYLGGKFHDICKLFSNSLGKNSKNNKENPKPLTYKYIDKFVYMFANVKGILIVLLFQLFSRLKVF